MHIAYLIPTLDRIGGAERQLILLATGMARRGWRVTVIALSGSGGHAADELSANDVSFISLQMRRGLLDPRGWNRLRRWIAAAQPEILHAHLPHAALLARAIRIVTPIRVVIDTIHSPATGSLARRIGYRLTSYLPNLVTAVSRSAARPWLGAHAVGSRELIVIQNGIDTEYWKPSSKHANNLQSPTTDSEFHWLAVGRLDPVKDHVTLLRAFASLPSSARLTILGSGPLERPLRSQAAHLRIDERLRFLGFQSDVRSYLQQANAFVLSSRWEGLPIALMEACSCELPSVFTETAGSRELLPDSPLPVAPVGDPAALAQAMKTLMNLPASKRRELGHDARQQIVARHDQQSVINRLEILYCHLLSENTQPSRHRRNSRAILNASICSSTTEP
jgi:glycosyltransferase involved in cell wall biosynthesis